MWARVISGIIGAFMLLQAFTWLIDPSAAAAGLALVALSLMGGLPRRLSPRLWRQHEL